MAIPPKLYQFLVATFASLGSSLFGYDLGVIAGAIAAPSFVGEFSPNTNETGAVVSVFTGGAFFGAAFAGAIADRFGRKWTIFTGSLIFLLGAALQCAAQGLSYLYAGRAIAGLGIGALVMIIPMYQAELCHPDIRGAVTSLQQFMLGIGALLASWVAFGAWNYPNDDSKQWRLPLGIQLVPGGFLFLLIMFFPESPRWLISRGHHAEGLKTLAKLHSNGDESNAWVRAEFDQIRQDLAIEQDQAARSFFELFQNKSSVRRLIIACAIQASIQMTGVSAIQYYSVIIFKQIGITGYDTLKYQGIGSVIALLGEMSCMAFIDRIGRRWTLIGCMLGNAVVFLVATVLSAIFPPETSGNAAAGWGFIVMTWAEIFDTRTRAKGVAIATMTSFAFNTMIGQVTSIAMANVGYRFYITFIVCNVTNALFFWAFLPETKKLPLEEMNYLFTSAPLFVPTMDTKQFRTNDLEARVAEIEAKEADIEHLEGQTKA